MLDRFDELVADGHDELVLSRGADGEFWLFSVDGFGDHADAAWAYGDRFELQRTDCDTAEVREENR